MSRLIEEVLTLSEILELKGDPTGLAEGTVIESQVAKNSALDPYRFSIFLNATHLLD